MKSSYLSSDLKDTLINKMTATLKLSDADGDPAKLKSLTTHHSRN